MSHKFLIYILLFLCTGCISPNNEQTAVKEEWADKPISEWPAFALTNSIEFSDTTYENIANAFLINTGYDTIAATCKHIFMVFRNNRNINTIYLNDDFISWKMFPKGQKEKNIFTEDLINSNPNEEVGQFNTLKDRDWIIFEIDKTNSDIYPLKIRKTPLNKNEIVYCVGWATAQETKIPSLIKMQIYQNLGNYYYFTTLTENVNPVGRSGSPVIDRNGYLVGLISGAEGNLGVMASVAYLKKLLNEFDIDYEQ